MCSKTRKIQCLLGIDPLFLPNGACTANLVAIHNLHFWMKLCDEGQPSITIQRNCRPFIISYSQRFRDTVDTLKLLELEQWYMNRIPTKPQTQANDGIKDWCKQGMPTIVRVELKLRSSNTTRKVIISHWSLLTPNTTLKI